MALEKIKEKIRELREELINSLDSYEDEKNPHTPTKKEIEHLEIIFKDMIELYSKVRSVEGKLSENIIKETHQIAKGIRMYDPLFIYIHHDIIAFMEILPDGVLV
ncbi:MAG TPA: hypothetical protein PL110_11025 [Candidatus Eremiobacteraeota bacterium]|nr:MAG: hypothetical protein BWY64_03643 [bacterium ADurb.Bin363]HPZ08637.1 hypothetical protein [Candidatus Eremiobacteraeota bacterium]